MKTFCKRKKKSKIVKRSRGHSFVPSSSYMDDEATSFSKDSSELSRKVRKPFDVIVRVDISILFLFD